MAYRSRRRRRQNQLAKLVALGTGIVVIMAVVIALIVRGGQSANTDAVLAVARPVTTEQPAAQAPAADETPAPDQAPAEDAAPTQTEAAQTAAPEVAAQPEIESAPTPEASGADPYLSIRPAAKDGFLPVFDKARNVTEKIVAITVDDCFQFTNTRKIIDLAIQNGGKLTLFPIAKNALRDELQDTIRYAHDSGMEIENHTYSHDGLYSDTDEELAAHICMADRAMDYILGVNYQGHFLRPRGGDDRHDQRTHQYIKQLGYYGIAHWTASGSSTDLGKLKANVAPGKIYLFHTTNNDLNKLKDFIPWLASNGYRMVTLNEMFGYPENEVEPLEASMEELQTVIPLAPYQEVLVDLGKGDYTYAANKLQARLIELGYLEGKADGVYGKDTFIAVGYFQLAAGMKPTGQADVQTQQLLYAADAPRNPSAAAAAQPQEEPQPEETPEADPEDAPQV